MNADEDQPEWDYRTSAARHEAIARRAYELWTRAGKPENQAITFWLRAEHEMEREFHEPPVEPVLPVSF